jgi:hypothetical protein
VSEEARGEDVRQADATLSREPPGLGEMDFEKAPVLSSQLAEGVERFCDVRPLSPTVGRAAGEGHDADLAVSKRRQSTLGELRGQLIGRVDDFFLGYILDDCRCRQSVLRQSDPAVSKVPSNSLMALVIEASFGERFGEGAATVFSVPGRPRVRPESCAPGRLSRQQLASRVPRSLILKS